MSVPYSFSVLRYIHDPVTQEFLNIGVAVFSAEAEYLNAICTTKYGRISETFCKIDGVGFRQLSQHIQDSIRSAGSKYSSSLPFEPNQNIEQILAKVLPRDDSSIQFSKAGVGLSSDLDQTLQDLYKRYVEKYLDAGELPGRSDDEVWRVFRGPLDRVLVTPHLNPKRIVAPDYDYEFQRSWKNEIWHVYEPVSFDMVEAASILDKANRWLGRATSLNDSAEPFRIHLLIGEPKDERLKPASVKAENILNKMPVKKDFIKESDAESFAEELASEMKKHA